MEHVRPPPVENRLSPPGRSGQVVLLARREAAAKLTSFWFFLVAAILSLMAFFHGAGFQHVFETESVLVTADPLRGLNAAIVTFLGAVLGLRLATSLSAEREHGTLEVLLAGPVTWTALVVAKYLSELVVLVGLTGLYGAYIVLAQPLGPGLTPLRSLLPILLALIHVLPLMAAGLLVSAWAGSVRLAVVSYLAILSLLSLYEGLLGLLRGMDAETMSLFALYLRATLDGIEPLMHLVSPVSGIASVVAGVLSDDGQATGPWGQSIVLSLVLIGLARLVAGVKGA